MLLNHSQNHNLLLNPNKLTVKFFGTITSKKFALGYLHVITDANFIPITITARNLGLILDDDWRF